MSDYPEGWYDDPNDQDRQRYWDGAQWTDEVRQKFQPGWYEDPKRYAAERYWDGSAWTDEHRFVTVLDDIYRAPKLRKIEWRLVVSGEHLAWGEDSIRWDDVTGFDSTINKMNTGKVVGYDVEISAEKHKLNVNMAAEQVGNHVENAIATIIDTAHRILTPRFTNELFPRADAGEVIELQKVALSPQGFGKKGKDPVPWSEFAGFNQGSGNYFQIWRKNGDKPKRVAYFPTSQLERWILSAMLNDYSSRYGGGATG